MAKLWYSPYAGVHVLSRHGTRSPGHRVTVKNSDPVSCLMCCVMMHLRYTPAPPSLFSLASPKSDLARRGFFGGSARGIRRCVPNFIFAHNHRLFITLKNCHGSGTVYAFMECCNESNIVNLNYYISRLDSNTVIYVVKYCFCMLMKVKWDAEALIALWLWCFHIWPPQKQKSETIGLFGGGGVKFIRLSVSTAISHTRPTPDISRQIY